MDFVHKPWRALTTDELYALLALRAEVFVVEQRCPYQDLDGADRLATHLWIPSPEGAPLAYARLFAPGQALRPLTEETFEEILAKGKG